MAYSLRFREKMVVKMLSRGARSVNELSRESGVSPQTLMRWVQTAKQEPMATKSRTQKSRRRRLSAEQKLELVMEAEGLSDDELGAFLRRHGLHSSKLAEMRAAAVESLRAKSGRRGRLSPQEVELRRVRKELRRKEAALAETAALLVLRGKVQAFL